MTGLSFTIGVALILGLLATPVATVAQLPPPYHQGGGVQQGKRPTRAIWWRAMGSRAAAPDNTATRAVRAGASTATGLLLGTRSPRMRLMALGSRCLDSGSPRVRLGSGALAVVSVRLGMARGTLGLLRSSYQEFSPNERRNARWRDARESSASI